MEHFVLIQKLLLILLELWIGILNIVNLKYLEKDKWRIIAYTVASKKKMAVVYVRRWKGKLW